MGEGARSHRGNLIEMIKTNNNGALKEDDVREGASAKACVLAEEKILHKKHRRRRNKESDQSSTMEMTTKVDVHKSAPARVHTSARRNRSQSRHEKHKCHKHRQKVEEAELASQVTQLKAANYLLNRRLNASVSSIDSGLPTSESLPPFEIDVKKAYQHIKQENVQLLSDVQASRIDYENVKSDLDKQLEENACLKDDVAMLKNLVYRLNVELEKFQDARLERRGETVKKPYELPQYYNKNFVKPIMPLLRAYSETIDDKNEVIENLESNFDKFNLSFNELLKENETLYKELEAKLTRGDDSIFDEVQLLRSEIKLTREEKDILESHVKLEVDKIEEIKAVFQSKVSLLERERNIALDQLQQARADLHILQGKHCVVKQELERIRSEDETKVPLPVHSASVAECKRLFQELKNDHDLEKQEFEHKLNDSHSKLLRRADELKKNEQERLTLEQSNFDLVLECDSLRQRIAQYEKRLEGCEIPGDQNAYDRDIRTRLSEAVKKNEDLEEKLQKAKKKLQLSMAFAEDLVKEQESLLSQLHEKQRENTAMASHFGSLRKKLKNVERGANAGLEEVEETIRNLRAENDELLAEVDRLNMLLREKQADVALDTEETSS